MQHLKFFSLFQALDEKEVQAFVKYLKLMHAGEDVALKVFGYVKKFYPHFEDDKKLDLDYAYQKIFRQPVSDKSRKNLLNTFSDLHLWLKDFLLQEKVRQDASIREILWLNILRERELNNEFSKSATRFYESKTARPPDSMTNGIEQITAAHFLHQKMVLSPTKPEPDALSNCLQTIKEAADTICTRIQCEQAHLQTMLPSKADTTEQTLPSASPLRMAYDEIILMLTGDPLTEADHFTKTFQILEEHVAAIAPEERYMLIKYLRNFAAYQIRNKNMEKFGPILRRINQYGLESGAFTQKGVMSVTEFSSIVNSACSAKDFDWAEQFIADKADLLPTDIRHETVTLAYAMLDFVQEKYKEVWQKLETVTFERPADHVRAKLLLVRAYYEDEPEHIDLLLECDRFENWLYRHRKPKTQDSSPDAALRETILAASGFMQIFKLLAHKRLDKSVLLDRINKTYPLFLDHWLKAKLIDYNARYAPHKLGK
jgi:hypothetical protein